MFQILRLLLASCNIKLYLICWDSFSINHADDNKNAAKTKQQQRQLKQQT